MLKIGLLINPLAGIGGPLALKGSDDTSAHAAARAGGQQGRGVERAIRALVAAGAAAGQVRWFAWGGDMGMRALKATGCQAIEVGSPVSGTGGPLVAEQTGTHPVLAARPALPSTSAADTRQAALALRDAGVDLLLFAGGDGTARDVLDAVGQTLPVLGIPAGVKMHSGVFATTPESAGAIIAALVAGGLVRSTLADVRDLDEGALAEGILRPRYFGELRVPEQGGFLQHTKEGGRENTGLALEEIVAELVERVREEGGCWILGPGSTLAAIKSALGLEPTLLGIDVLVDGQQVGRDVNAAWLLDFLQSRAVAAGSRPQRAELVLSFTRRQGFLLGRGNQQLTPAVLRLLGRDALHVVGSRTKLLSLGGCPLLIDTDDSELDAEWAGLVEVITGYDDRLWYRVASTTAADAVAG